MSDVTYFNKITDSWSFRLLIRYNSSIAGRCGAQVVVVKATSVLFNHGRRSEGWCLAIFPGSTCVTIINYVNFVTLQKREKINAVQVFGRKVSEP